VLGSGNGEGEAVDPEESGVRAGQCVLEAFLRRYFEECPERTNFVLGVGEWGREGE
jgi:hypothetical protein